MRALSENELNQTLVPAVSAASHSHTHTPASDVKQYNNNM